MRSVDTGNVRRNCLLASMAACLALLGAPASASALAEWQLDSLSNTTAQPGEILDYRVEVANIGDEGTSSDPTVLEISLPDGFSVADPAGPVSEPSHPHFHPGNFFVVSLESFEFHPCTQADGISPLEGGETEVRCEHAEPLGPFGSGGGVGNRQRLYLPVEVDPLANPGDVLTTQLEISGGGATPAATVDPVRVAAIQPGFGIDAFDTQIRDGAGQPFTQAGGHPEDIVTDIDLNSIFDPTPIWGPLKPAEAVKDVFVDLPPGFLGNPSGLGRCTAEQLSQPDGIISRTFCPAGSQVGGLFIRLKNEQKGDVQGPFPIFNMVPPTGSPARFGFKIDGTSVVLDARLRSEGDYGLSVDSRNIVEVLPIVGLRTIFWGRPGSAANDAERACPGFDLPSRGGPPCAGNPEVTFLRNPTSCSADGLDLTMRTDSWDHPGLFESRTIETHQPPGYPAHPDEWGIEQGIEGCEDVPVEGSLQAKPSSRDAETSSGLSVRVEVPNPGLENPTGIAASDVKKVKVALPRGITVNPSQAEGLGVCTPAQYKSTELSFHETSTGCPEDSKIGTVEVQTPLLEEKIPGDVYIAQQDDPGTSAPGAENPFDSLLAIYIVLAEPQRGVLVKLPGEVDLEDPEHPGQIVTSFDDLPQLPFSSFDFKFREGARAPLVTPPTCGKYTTETEITGWSSLDPETGAVAPEDVLHTSSSFLIDRGIGGGPCPPGGTPGFQPGFSAGAINNNAGAFSPFVMRLTRRDGEQNLTKFSSVLPPGVVAKIAGVGKCSEAQIAAAMAQGRTGRAELAAPSCPASSQIGRTLAGAGVGSVLTYVPGRLYLAGPYNGAPLSVVAITPAVAGPFDVGVVVVREALTLDPITAEVHVDGDKSDPIPHLLKGIPLKLRDLRVYVDRQNFTINPTSCDPAQVGATLWGSAADVFNPADDAPVGVSSRFQASNCSSLGFKPRLSLRLKGGTRRGAHPALRAVFRPRPGDANLERTVVKLPKSAFLDQAHIRTICTRVQFAADSCPKGAVYGKVTAFSPLLDEPLKGPAYLRSSNNKLPDLVFDLHGVVDIETSARIDSVRGGIRATFPFVPDAPLTKVVVEMQGGRKGLIVNSRNLCAAPSRAEVKLDGHNGKVRDFNPVVKPRCGKRGSRRG